ncbi:MAG: cyclic nucleotide-binding domain-containing protein [Nitrospinae bacterium]|nr:cyclic nucleotide-binding domain-containing protein [Nitrospinota bacterium]
MSALTFSSPIKETPVLDPGAVFDILGADDACPREAWDKLTKLTGKDGRTPYLRIITVPPGVAFIKKGEVDMHVFIVIEGTVEAMLRDENGKAKTAKKCFVGDCVGELAVVEGTARAADVQASADGPARLLKIDWSITEKEGSSDIALSLVKLVLKKIAQNTRSGYEAIGRVIEKAGSVMKSQEDVIRNLKDRNRALTDSISSKETLIAQMRQALLTKGVKFDTMEIGSTGDELPADINIDAAISLLQGALSQIKSA